MAKTLRVRTADGWVTKPLADEPENRLTAEEVDDNFLSIEGESVTSADISSIEVVTAYPATEDPTVLYVLVEV